MLMLKCYRPTQMLLVYSGSPLQAPLFRPCMPGPKSANVLISKLIITNCVMKQCNAQNQIWHS